MNQLEILEAQVASMDATEKANNLEVDVVAGGSGTDAEKPYGELSPASSQHPQASALLAVSPALSRPP